ncbi:hypothetical protein IU450_34030 [Nocardia abscessus]|uniref:DUF6879 family protein n=1 Tax=Nocardia abscessus TaxID=120957 RepID=UPI0018959B5F|nr:DUF6879 family protein [Nocardia abscessus]MBF6340872.1 hypothetical protein [Nocardia abscessus]
MRLLLGAEPFRAVLATAKQRAFHLETRDDYLTENEEPSLAAFREDETTDPGGEWFTGWQEQVTAAVARGVVMQRARIVSEPHTLYTRYLLALTRHNVAAGEDVRYLPRRDADPADAAADDFWLIDDDLVAYSLFDERGYWVGAASTDDPVIVSYAAEVRDRVWSASTPYAEYLQRR